MTPAEQLSEYTGRVPFEPFFVKLSSGETIIVAQRFKAAASRRQFAVTTDGRTMRFIRYEEIEKFGIVAPEIDSAFGIADA